MPQEIKDLIMLYHKRPNGNLCLIRAPEEAFGFSSASALDSVALELEKWGFNLVARAEEVRIDTRFPFGIDPPYVDIAYNAERCGLPLPSFVRGDYAMMYPAGPQRTKQ